MSIFSRRLKAGMVQGTYTPVDRRGPLGTQVGTPVAVSFLIDEGGSENWQKTEAEHASNVLIYADPASVIGSRTCVGGRLVDNSTGRKFTIVGFDVAKNQHTGAVDHVELTAKEEE